MTDQQPKPLNVRIAEIRGEWPLDPTRCDRCGWPMNDESSDCHPGHCSQRPLPPKIEPHDYEHDADFCTGVQEANWIELLWHLHDDGKKQWRMWLADAGDVVGEGLNRKLAILDWVEKAHAAGVKIQWKP